jgi:hypothetical protein
MKEPAPKKRKASAGEALPELGDLTGEGTGEREPNGSDDPSGTTGDLGGEDPQAGKESSSTKGPEAESGPMKIFNVKIAKDCRERLRILKEDPNWSNKTWNEVLNLVVIMFAQSGLLNRESLQKLVREGLLPSRGSKVGKTTSSGAGGFGDGAGGMGGEEEQDPGKEFGLVSKETKDTTGLGTRWSEIPSILDEFSQEFKAAMATASALEDALYELAGVVVASQEEEDDS